MVSVMDKSASDSWLHDHVFVCPVCQGQVVIEFPEIDGPKWHGFMDGNGHFLDWARSRPAVTTEQVAMQGTTPKA